MMPATELLEWSVLGDVKQIESVQREHDALHSAKGRGK